MKTALHANMCDQSTQHIADALYEPFRQVSAGVSGDYGGTMEHLWIDYELLKPRGASDRSGAFRFQKKVGGTSKDPITGLPRGTWYNVGHYSVVPDRAILLSAPAEDILGLALSEIYRSTSVLLKQKRRLGAFDVHRFRADYVAVCSAKGYSLAVDNGAR